MADRAVRGIHLGSVPHGYRMLDPAMRKVSVAAHVRFVEDACPGVVVTREGWEDVVPWFADDYNPLAPRAPEGEAADDVADDSILDGISPPPVVRELAADRGGGAAASDSGSTADGGKHSGLKFVTLIPSCEVTSTGPGGRARGPVTL